MKIAHIISSSGFFGAERVMVDLACGLKAKGHEVWVVALENRHNPHLEVIEEAERLGLFVHVVPSEGRIDFSSSGKLADFIKEKGIEIVHAHNYKADLLTFLALRKIAIPKVATLHGYIHDSWKLKGYEAFDRWLMRFFDKVVLVDKSLERWFQNGEVNTQVINNGVDTELYRAAALESGRDIVFGIVGRLSAEKGHRYLLEAFARLLKDVPSARLLIVGDGPLCESYKLQVTSHKLEDKVIFTGFQKDVVLYYRQMDVVVQSSTLEHFPVALLEAMSCGKAIVATDVGGTSKMVKDGETGFLIRAASVDELFAKMKILAQDFPLRQRLGRSAAAFVRENYSLDKTVSAYERVYKEVLC